MAPMEPQHISSGPQKFNTMQLRFNDMLEIQNRWVVDAFRVDTFEVDITLQVSLV